MSKNKDIRDIILDYLEDYKYWSNTGWVSIHCPFCESSSGKRHFNIRLIPGTPLYYQCFHSECEAFGLLNKKVCNAIGIKHPEVIRMIEAENRNAKVRKEYVEYAVNSKHMELGEISDIAEEYFKKRTGVSARDNAELFRITSNIGRFYRDNKSKLSYKKLKFLMYQENNSDVGFLYFFNEEYTMCYYRELKPDGKKGKASIVDGSSIAKHKPYIIRRINDEEYTVRGSTILTIAEGTFDIINTYLHITKTGNGYYCASTGFAATKRIILEFAKYFYKPRILIISDSDVTENYYRYKLLPAIKDRISSLHVGYNRKAKDVGDISEEREMEFIKLMFITNEEIQKELEGEKDEN